MKKKVVLVNQDSGYLMIDIANAFADKYHEVFLLAGRVVPMGQTLNPKIKVIKIKEYNKRSTITRMNSWIIAFIQVLFLMQFRFRYYDLFISSNPPLATLLPLICKNRTSILIYDIYPDGLIAGKFLQPNNSIIRVWKKLNRIAYKKVNHIITLTQGMSDLLTQYVDSLKITIIPAWSNKAFELKHKEFFPNKFLEKYSLHNKFLIVYSGNLGKEYELEAMIQLAGLLVEQDNARVLIVGEGWQKQQLEALINEMNLKNCLLLPRQTPEMFEAMMDAMSLGVVSLGKAVSKIAIPSKTYNILACGKPLLCIGSKDSDLAAMISNHSIGKTFHSDEIQAMFEFVDLLSKTDSKVYMDFCNRAQKTSTLFTSQNAKKIVDLVK